MRDCKFWAAASFAAGGLIVMAIMGTNGYDGVHTADIVRAGILAGIVLATWLVLYKQKQAEKRDAQIMARLAELKAAHEDREELVCRTIFKTLQRVGHDLDRPDAKLYQIRP